MCCSSYAEKVSWLPGLSAFGVWARCVGRVCTSGVWSCRLLPLAGPVVWPRRPGLCPPCSVSSLFLFWRPTTCRAGSPWLSDFKGRATTDLQTGTPFLRPAHIIWYAMTVLFAVGVGYLLWSISLPIVFPPRLLALPRDALLRRQTVIFLLQVSVSLGPYE